MELDHHLDGCRERLRHAEEQIEALVSRRAEWVGSHHEYTTEYEAGSGWHVFRTKYVQSPPLSFGALVSDYIHQLRATLDNLVCALVELNGTTCTRSHSFPIVAEETAWERAKASQLDGLRADHIAEIRSAQPFMATYSPALHPLATLHDLNRLDKHRFLVPTTISFADAKPNVTARKAQVEVKEIVFTPGTPVEEERVFLRVRTEPDDPEPDLNLKQAIPIYLSFGVRPVSERDLNRIGMCVHELVNRPAFQS